MWRFLSSDRLWRYSKKIGEGRLALLDVRPQSKRPRRSSGNRELVEQQNGRIKVEIESEDEGSQWPSCRGSVFPVHLTPNMTISSMGFDAIKSRTGAKGERGCPSSRLTRCLSCRPSGVMSIKARRKSFSNGTLPEIILNLNRKVWSALLRYNASFSRSGETFVSPAKRLGKFLVISRHRRLRKDMHFDLKRGVLRSSACQFSKSTDKQIHHTVLEGGGIFLRPGYQGHDASSCRRGSSRVTRIGHHANGIGLRAGGATSQGGWVEGVASVGGDIGGPSEVPV
jgi:hypothetical protein